MDRRNARQVSFFAYRHHAKIPVTEQLQLVELIVL
jgi:hypothetical protein